MAVRYPKCSHARPRDAVIPDWQCHACSDRHARSGLRPGPALGKVSKLLMLVALASGLNHAIRHGDSVASDDVAVLPIAALHMPEAESSLLRSMPGRLAAACDRTRDSLGQQECRTRLHARSSACMAQVARHYPALPGNMDRMAAIIHTYQNCVFGS